MKNLEATESVVISSVALISQGQSFCVDSDRHSVWIATRNDLCRVEEGEVHTMAPLGDVIVGMEFVSDLESVCLALSGGNMLTYNTQSDELECVGSVDVGLAGMSWSPDQEVVILVTRDNKLVLMTMNFDPITETSLYPNKFGEAAPVTVGWGKKETQFHGSQGKPKQHTVKPDKVVFQALPSDDKKTRISWRGDGEYFVSSCIDPASGSRTIRVWNRMCVLQSTTESLEGLGQCLDWRPSGNLIASIQRKPHRQDVVFFEHNGLQHGEFPLRTGDGEWIAKEVSWNNDSSVLAVLLEAKDSENQGSSSDPLTRVQLWTVGNYHWYLKQEIRIPSRKHSVATPTSDLVGIAWDPIKPLRLHMLSTDGNYMCYNWRWSVATNYYHSSRNSAPVAVIDGASVLLTLFRHTVIPPPMCTHTLALPTPVNAVTFAPPPFTNDLLCQLSNGQLAMFGFEEHKDSIEGSSMEVPKRVTKGTVNGVGVVDPQKDSYGFRRVAKCPTLVGVTSNADFQSVRHVTWWKRNKLLAVDHVTGIDVLTEFTLSVDKMESTVSVSKCCSVPLPSSVFCLCTNPNSGTTVVSLHGGQGLLRAQSECGRGPSELCLIPTEGGGLCLPRGQTFSQVSLTVFKEEEYAIGLNEFSGSLYVGETQLTTGCNSFAVHNEFLLITTTAHLLRFFPRNLEPKEMILHDNVHKDETVRHIERGSKIVTVVPYDSKVVLQMPRGNLETIHPRALVLSTVRRALDCLDFKSAFVTMRKHRVNLNLIHDHSPKVFMDNVQQFLEQLDCIAHINLFLTELKEEDVTVTMYAPSPDLSRFNTTLEPAVTREGVGTTCERGGATCDGGGVTKVDRVCEAVKKALVNTDEKKYLLSIITAHVRKTAPDLEAVLTLLKQLKSHSDPDKPGQTEEAIKYTLFLVDVNELYNVALGMYDFDLVMMVAQKSQKDPKEYLPFLNELKQLPVDYQRYRIDLFLRRFNKALLHISKCGSEKFPECLSLVCDQSLYPQALRIYRDLSSSEYKAIANCYGSHLREKGRHKEAGLIFSECGSHEEAIKSFEKAGEWRSVFPLSSQLQHSLTDRIVLARRIAASLRSGRRHSEAAQVLIDYAQDIEEGVVTLLEGSCWHEAMRITHLHSRTDLIETHIRPDTLESQQSQLLLFESLEVTFLRHCSRLNVVRQRKREKDIAILEGTYAVDEKDADLFSDTSSITGRSVVSSANLSVLSKASGRSSKNRRKAERKKHSLREGSANEDLALVEALSEIVSTVDRLQDEVGHLVSVLVQFGLWEQGHTLQSGFQQLLTTVKGRSSEVWSPENQQLEPPDLKELTGAGATVNSIVAAMQSSRPVTATLPSFPKLRDSVDWKLDIF